MVYALVASSTGWQFVSYKGSKSAAVTTAFIHMSSFPAVAVQTVSVVLIVVLVAVSGQIYPASGGVINVWLRICVKL